MKAEELSTSGTKDQDVAVSLYLLIPFPIDVDQVSVPELKWEKLKGKKRMWVPDTNILKIDNETFIF